MVVSVIGLAALAAALIAGIVLRVGNLRGDLRYEGSAWTIWAWVLTFAVVFAVPLAVDLIGTTIANLSLAHHDQYRNVPLLALRDDVAPAGSYVLGTGNSGSDAKFVFYWQDNGAERLDTVEASDVRLYEDSEHPYAVQFTGCQLSKPSVAWCFNAAPEFTELHVPPGSVHSQFDLSLNGGGR